jgi:drug/metabolite transporter superfamily protein YnfA
LSERKISSFSRSWVIDVGASVAIIGMAIITFAPRHV